MEVIIVGGGIGGLALALNLHAAKIKCTVYEAVSDLKIVGVGINLQVSGVLELYKLGLQEELEKTGIKTRELAY